MSEPTVTVELTREQLEEIEYCKSWGDSGDTQCPSCVADRVEPHDDDCWIGKALKELGEEA